MNSTLPLPAEAQALDAAAVVRIADTISPASVAATTPKGWQWSLGRLEGQSQALLTATLQLQSLPAGQALILRPEAMAAGLSLPTTTVGGAVVLAAEAARPIRREIEGRAVRRDVR